MQSNNQTLVSSLNNTCEVSEADRHDGDSQAFMTDHGVGGHSVTRTYHTCLKVLLLSRSSLAGLNRRTILEDHLSV